MKSSNNSTVFLLTNINSTYFTSFFDKDTIARINFLDYESYMISLRSVNLYHDGINNINFELVCFKRFLIMDRLINEYKIDHILHLDSDIAVGSSLFNCFPSNIEANTVYAPFRSSTYCSLWGKDSLNKYVDNLILYDQECRQKKPSRNSDMNYMQYLIDNNVINFCSISKKKPLQIHSLRAFLIKNIIPSTPLSDDIITQFNLHDIFSYNQLIKYYPYEYLKTIFNYDNQNGNWSVNLNTENIPLDFIHFQGGGAKDYFLPFLSEKLQIL
jgi:hypothetical protein